MSFEVPQSESYATRAGPSYVAHCPIDVHGAAAFQKWGELSCSVTLLPVGTPVPCQGHRGDGLLLHCTWHMQQFESKTQQPIRKRKVICFNPTTGVSSNTINTGRKIRPTGHTLCVRCVTTGLILSRLYRVGLTPFAIKEAQPGPA